MLNLEDKVSGELIVTRVAAECGNVSSSKDVAARRVGTPGHDCKPP